MADPIKSSQVAADDAGAPIAKDALDPDMIKLKRARPKIGLVTAAGLVFLCGLFLVRLGPDRRFADSGDAPDRVQISDVLGGRVALDRFVQLNEIELEYSHAIRTTTAKGSLGVRVVPVRGTGEHVWIAVSGDGWDRPANGVYAGRLRELSALPFAASVEAFAKDHPRPVFVTPAALHAGLATNSVQTISGDTIKPEPGDKLAFDVVDPDSSTVIGALNDKLPTARDWAMALVAAGIPANGTPETTRDTVRFHVLAGADAVAPKLEAAQLWGARVESVTTHYETTWSALGSAAAGIPAGKDGKVIPDAQLDLVGAYVARGVPAGALVLLTEERPADYWYVLPITIALAAIGLVFAWALVRAVKRDVLSP
ncbi:MAG TPA: hypothetical protein VH143_12290 [Kofleriaceae bacterium]|nr:hypothetical protein [Kofleriaceae bacterium]